MQLGYAVATAQQGNDQLLGDVLQNLATAGHDVAGVVQIALQDGPEAPCPMALRMIPGGSVTCITQKLGPNATGCSLDPRAMAEVAGHLEALVARIPPALLILNKFGKQEVAGSGFRAVIAAALLRDIPVLLGVGQQVEGAFLDFAGDFAERVPATRRDLRLWAEAAMARG